MIPVASTEQHGDHLPVNTDANICYTIAVAAAQSISEFPVLVLPAIWTGYSPHHMAHPGTITLQYPTFVDLLTQVAISVHRHGFQKIFFLNGHYGNGPVIAALRTKLADEQNFAVIGYNYWDLPNVAQTLKKVCPTDKGFLGHSGEVETSLQLYLQPDAVDMNAASWVTGVWGDPSAGSAEKGKQMHEAIVKALAQTLRNYHSGALEDTLVWRKEIL
ncbi:MAG: creatininase family protein [Deltaproteobacteria bacterium]|nr:creatininase family protein [Deltaproteobacteria bacterium]